MIALAAVLLAAAAPAADTRAADAALAALHESVCVRQRDPGADFRPVTGSDAPADVPGSYIGPAERRYWRRAGPLPAFVMLSRGPGHWGGIEEYCVVAVQGARFEPMVRTYARRLGISWIFGADGRPRTWQRGGSINATLSGSHGRASIMVTQRPDGWVSLFSGGQVSAQTQRPGR